MSESVGSRIKALEVHLEYLKEADQRQQRFEEFMRNAVESWDERCANHREGCQTNIDGRLEALAESVSEVAEGVDSLGREVEGQKISLATAVDGAQAATTWKNRIVWSAGGVLVTLTSAAAVVAVLKNLGLVGV